MNIMNDVLKRAAAALIALMLALPCAAAGGNEKVASKTGGLGGLLRVFTSGRSRSVAEQPERAGGQRALEKQVAAIPSPFSAAIDVAAARE